MTTPDTKTRTGCKAVDQIVTWDQVKEGDLVLYKGELETVAEVSEDANQPAYIALRFDGTDRTVWVRRDHRTAVTRYVETSSQDTEDKR